MLSSTATLSRATSTIARNAAREPGRRLSRNPVPTTPADTGSNCQRTSGGGQQHPGGRQHQRSGRHQRTGGSQPVRQPANPGGPVVSEVRLRVREVRARPPAARRPRRAKQVGTGRPQRA